MSRPKHKEVTRYAAGLNIHLDKRPDEVVVTPFTLVETAKTFRLKKEDSREFRTAARFLIRAVFSKDNPVHMAQLCDSPKAALTHYYKSLERRHDNAQAQMRNYYRLMVDVMTKIREVEANVDAN